MNLENIGDLTEGNSLVLLRVGIQTDLIQKTDKDLWWTFTEIESQHLETSITVWHSCDIQACDHFPKSSLFYFILVYQSIHP